ncbi:alpha-E domain-containing protein [Pseudodonghicola flavimaris]|uniref:Alpha-E domain-containing protein n=1 Tax=Pseudodonghicola flavimaris TaxID=3050036 RepID=A0ABT7F2A4_9RHOB|nr:alpha-E domain-containing protein [Pseudodonghicola flavimaris]MDK3018742.1 alpha-E domain-containing protein [Pseudodonghicola flavimaris]
MTLGKNAGGLYWMFRYLERAENTARLLEAGWYIALTHANNGTNEWESILTTAGMNEAYLEKHESFEAASAINFLLRDKSNSSSVMSAIEAARSNARMVRTALSGEVWEAVNECWMELKAALARPVTERNLHETLMMVRNRTSVVRGALHGTMLRNDIYAFSRLGTFLERADNTARILDVKYYVLLPSASFVGSSIDNVQWEVILRSVSAERSYHWLNGGDLTPQGIAEFLILDKRMPRSLAFCCTKISQYLGLLEEEYGQRQESQIQAERICARVSSASVEAIFDEGLHEFLAEFLADAARLSGLIETDFKFYG